MKLACNWSKELDTLLNKSEVEIDYFKAGAVGDYEDLFSYMRKTHPILLHGFGNDLYAGTPTTNDIDFTKLNRLLTFCASPHFGIHLSVNQADVMPGITDYDIGEKMIANIDVFKKNIDLPLLVENVPDCNRDRNFYGHHPFYSAELISHVIKTANVGFLLDITHAQISCVYNGMDFYSYVSSLPLDRVYEVHVNGTGIDENGSIADTHAAMTDDDFNRLQWVLERTKPKIVTLEYGWQEESIYGADEDILKETLVKLKQIVSYFNFEIKEC